MARAGVQSQDTTLLPRSQGLHFSSGETGNLHRISARIEKNSELMPLVRWQYQGLPDSQRKRSSLIM